MVITPFRSLNWAVSLDWNRFDIILAGHAYFIVWGSF